ncbi:MULTISPECIES: alpha/beta family hydrolase [unclassified Mesorhizobium]|uniref:alpha/beta hydrolase family protein n=1 Tax=unclassified Mesorhizobium TaxID=325217 RepID=UPI0003D01F41|nr:alpha/beta family hydrolase [Mesorhizobium sp. L2C067A000]ESZ35926.1 alpha/beta hydrolase [Mesorhizobium sp. L2C067A000]
MPTSFLFDGFDTAPLTILLAHGAGASMDSPSMTDTAKAIATAGFQVARFEFHYMAARRYGQRKPPPRAETVNPEYIKAIADLRARGVAGPLIIGGKSMGGRVASMVADEMFAKGEISGLVCLGYPFHPPAKPEQLRTKHLADLKTPTLIFQGTRDEFGTKEEVATYGLSKAIEVIWLEDGDHDLKPRKSVSGFSTADHLKTLAGTVKAWTGRIVS